MKDEQTQPVFLNGGDCLKNKRSAFSLAQGIVTNVLLFLMVLLIGMYLFFVPVPISGPSMENSIFHEEKVLAQRMFFTIAHEDIVIIDLKAAGIEDKNIIKRVIATEGDSFLFKKTGKQYESKDVIGLYLKKSGETAYALLDESHYIKEPMISEGRFIDPTIRVYAVDTEVSDDRATVVGAGQFLALGDNRNISRDSREYGIFEEKHIFAKYLRTLDNAFLRGFFDLFFISDTGTDDK